MKEHSDQFPAGVRRSLREHWNALIEAPLFRQVMETYATRIGTVALGLAITIVVTRALGPEGRGVYAVALVVGTLGVQLGNLGFHASNTFYVNRQRGLLPTLVGNSLLMSLLLGGAAALAAGLLFHWAPQLAPLHGAILLLALLGIPFGLAYLLISNLMMGIGQVQLYNMAELGNRLAQFLVIGLAILLSRSTATSLFIASLIALLLTLAWLLWRIRGFLDRPPWPSLATFREHVPFGVRAYLVAVLGFLVLRLDLLMVQYMLGAADAGYYSLAVNLADILLMLPAVVALVLYSRLTTLADVPAKFRLTRNAVLATLVFFLPMLLVFGACARWVVPFVFGADFAPAVPAILWLLPGVFFLGIETVAAQHLNSIGFPRLQIVSWFFVLILNLGLNLKVIPAYGIVGASAVSSLTYLLACALILFLVWKDGRVRA
jgi:O-antigen/teichoic acid export membrane protein